MNTNTDLPDIQDLEKLANELFKALPNELPTEVSLDPSKHPRARAMADSVLNKKSQFIPDPLSFQAVPDQGLQGRQPTVTSAPSYAASGTNPSQLASTSGYTTNEKDTFNIEKSNQSKSPVIPPSVAGSGASPSYLKQGEHFDIKNPETSFNDPNLKNPKVQPGSGNDVFGFDHIFSKHISEILQNIITYNPGAVKPSPNSHQSFYSADKHLPIDTFTGIPTNDATYYFTTPHEISTNPFYKVTSPFGFDAYRVKIDFPILNEKVNGKPLIWFDNAATTQKPQAVIDRVSYFYEHENSNIHRAAHELAARATDAYESAREKVRLFLGAGTANEIIFVRGATEAINLVAQSWGDQYLNPGDEIIVSHLEHHANIVPWKRLADKKGLKIKVIPVDDDGQVLLEDYSKLLCPQTKLVAFTQVSNALGTITPAQQMVSMAHAVGAKVLVDGAQSVSHMSVNVKALDADWFVFSGHKVFGPTGIGVLYGKEELLNQTQPWQGGGNMIQDVTFEHIKYQNAPNRFEAGTGNIADAVGLGAAIDYVSKFGMEAIGAYEHFLLEYATNKLKQIPGVRLIGTATNKASVLSFTLQGYSNDEVGKRLNEEGIAVRTGHHCAQPILRRMGVETTVRPSLAFYNTCADVDVFIDVLQKLKAKK